MSTTVSLYINLVIQGLIALAVWLYYRERKFPAAVKYYTFGPRFWTGSVDSCVMWPITAATTFLLAMHLPTVAGALLLIVQNVAWLFYTVYMHARYGQTYGKMVCKVRVVDFPSEEAISFWQACLREGIPLAVSFGIVAYEVFAIASGALTSDAIAKGEIFRSKAFLLLAALPVLWFLAEAITMLTNERRRALHDFIAGTVVVRTNLQ
jgi:uncharacterized RDD family membrane protein YckC